MSAVLELTNLSWPEQPYGAGQRPFGQHPHLLAAVGLDWAHVPDLRHPEPVAACVVYLRVPTRGEPVPVVEGSFEFGFHTAVNAGPERSEMTAFVDRALERSNRHGVILAAHEFLDSLAPLRALAADSAPGITSVDRDWPYRGQRKRRGMASLYDTGIDVPLADRGDLAEVCAHHRIRTSLPAQSEIDAWTAGHVQDNDLICAEMLAAAAIRRALSIAMLAADALGLRAWDGVADVDRLVTLAAWDRFDRIDPGVPATATR